MAVEFQIVEHKECVRCYQPIDKRAAICPFCQSSQKQSKPYVRSILRASAIGLAALVLGCAVLFLMSLERERSSGLELARDLARTQSELNSVRSAVESERLTKAQLATVQLDVATDELKALVSRAESTVSFVINHCLGQSMHAGCLDIPMAASDDSLLMARLIGRFEALEARDAFCDQMRPVLTRLNRTSWSKIGAEIHDRYYLATANCWRSS